MNLKFLFLSLAVSLASSGLTPEAKADILPPFAKPDSVSEVFLGWDTGKESGDLLAQRRSRRVATLRAQNRGAHINLRSQPTVRSRSMGYGLPGDKVDLLQCVQDKDTRGSDLNWCQVQFPVSGAIGWIRSDFIIFPSDGE